MNLNKNLPTGTRDKLFREARAAYKIEQQVNHYLKNADLSGLKRLLSSLKMSFPLNIKPMRSCIVSLTKKVA